MSNLGYSALNEARRLFNLIVTLEIVPGAVAKLQSNVSFTSSRDLPYFPIPFKETEVTAALKAVEGCVASALADLEYGQSQHRTITVNLQKTTAFLFQAYLATVDGYGKLDTQVKGYLKGN